MDSSAVNQGYDHRTSSINASMRSAGNNQASPQQTNCGVQATEVKNQIPTASERNIVIRAFKYLADRIVAAVKFVWSKLFSSNSEINKDQDKHSIDPNLRNQEKEGSNQFLAEPIPKDNTEQSTVRGATSSDQGTKDDIPNNQPLDANISKYNQTDKKHGNEDTSQYNNAHNIQQTVIKAKDIAAEYLDDLHKLFKDNLSSLISYFPKANIQLNTLFSAISESVFDSKPSDNEMSCKISIFIWEAERKSPEYSHDFTKNALKFDNDHLQRLLMKEIDTAYKYLDPLNRFIKLYSLATYIASKIDETTDPKLKENLKKMKDKLEDIYIITFNNLVSYSCYIGKIKTKKVAIKLLNEVVSKKLNSEYKPVTEDQINKLYFPSEY